MILSTAKYEAECWATGKSNEELQEEINYLDSLWSMKHPNPFPKNAQHSYSRLYTLQEILKSRLTSSKTPVR